MTPDETGYKGRSGNTRVIDETPPLVTETHTRMVGKGTPKGLKIISLPSLRQMVVSLKYNLTISNRRPTIVDLLSYREGGFLFRERERSGRTKKKNKHLSRESEKDKFKTK